MQNQVMVCPVRHNPKCPQSGANFQQFAPFGIAPCRCGALLPARMGTFCRRSGRVLHRAVQRQTERSGKLVCIVPVRRVPLAEFPALRALGDHGASLALFPSAHIRNGSTLFCMTRMRVGVIPAPPPCCIGIRGGTLSRCCFAAGSCMGYGSIRC